MFRALFQKVEVDKPVTGKINTILGNVGNGKNTYAVAVARWISKRCKHGINLEKECWLCNKWKVENRKVKISANFMIDIPEVDCTFMKLPRDFFAIRRLRQHQLWIIDEPDAWGFDSRHRGPINDAIGRKIKQCRHYDADTLLINQLNSMIDLRGRRLSSDTFYAISPDALGFRYGLLKPDYSIPIRIPFKYAKEKIFPYYDTSTIIGEEEETQGINRGEPNNNKEVMI